MLVALQMTIESVSYMSAEASALKEPWGSIHLRLSSQNDSALLVSGAEDT